MEMEWQKELEEKGKSEMLKFREHLNKTFLFWEQRSFYNLSNLRCQSLEVKFTEQDTTFTPN